MPNRIIKESICTNEQIDQLTPFEETFFYRLIVNADDYGRMDGRIAVLRSRLFPLKTIRDDQIEKALHSLATVELVYRYNVHGKPFVSLLGWERNQSIRAKKSRFPAPEDADDNEHAQEYECTCMQMNADVPVIQSNQNTNPNQNPNTKGNARATRFSPPTVDDVRAYCSENRYTIDAQRFVDYYASNGWMVGKNRMKDWKATVRTWASRENSPAPARSAPNNPALNYQMHTAEEDRYNKLFIDLDNGEKE